MTDAELPKLPDGWVWSIGNYTVLAHQNVSPYKTVLMEGDEVDIGGGNSVPASVVSSVIRVYHSRISSRKT